MSQDATNAYLQSIGVAPVAQVAWVRSNEMSDLRPKPQIQQQFQQQIQPQFQQPMGQAQYGDMRQPSGMMSNGYLWCGKDPKATKNRSASQSTLEQT
eukprot:767821-Hanusia_phi.AAC.4